MKLPDFRTPWYHARASEDYVQDRLVAEAALRRLCLGAEVVGMYWDWFPQGASLLIKDGPRPRHDPRYARYITTRPYGTLSIGIGDQWTMLTAMPAPDARVEHAIADAVPASLPDEALQQLVQLRAQTITSIRLGIAVAHLLISFASGQVLFVHGDDPDHESWQASLDRIDISDPERHWMLINTPGGEISLWTPDDFDPYFDAEEPPSQ